MLNDKLNPFEGIIIRSRFVNGIYKMVRVEQVGDTFQGDFLTKVETGRAQVSTIQTANGGILVKPDGQTQPVLKDRAGRRNKSQGRVRQKQYPPLNPLSFWVAGPEGR